jgi:hypothetical protein
MIFYLSENNIVPVLVMLFLLVRILPGWNSEKSEFW